VVMATRFYVNRIGKPTLVIARQIPSKRYLNTDFILSETALTVVADGRLKTNPRSAIWLERLQDSRSWPGKGG
jgi:hypothetical protein